MCFFSLIELKIMLAMCTPPEECFCFVTWDPSSFDVCIFADNRDTCEGWVYIRGNPLGQVPVSQVFPASRGVSQC